MIAWSTLRPHPGVQAAAAASCCALSDFVLNSLLFIPLGAGLVLLGLRPLAAAGVGALVSVGIELSQLWWVVGRFASVADVATNLVGSGLGVLIATRWDRRTRWWPLVAPGLAVAVVLAWLVGGHLAQPAIPGPAPWRVEGAPTTPGGAPSRGEALALSLQGVSLPEGTITGLPALRARLAAADTVRFAATIVTGPASQKATRLVEIVVGEGSVPFLVLSRQGGTLLAYQRTGLSWVGLRGPWLTLKHALPLTAGDTVHVRLDATRRHLRLVAIRDGVERVASVTLSPDLYLSALFFRATDGALWWGLLPAMVSFILLGLALASRPKLLIVAGLAALFLSPNRGGCAYPEWPVVLVTVAGAWGGLRLGRLLGLFEGR